MKAFLCGLLRDTRGSETAEWILIAGLITTVAVAVYTGVLQRVLTFMLNHYIGMPGTL